MMLRGRKIVQQCYAVGDIDRAIEFWAEAFHVGPFFVADAPVQPSLIYRGEPSGMACRIALSYMGDLQIELIQQVNDSPSIYRDFAAHGDRLHHIMPDGEDFSADVEAMSAAGYEKAFWGEIPGLARFAYFDAVDRLGHFIELAEVAPEARGIFEGMKTACANWDGKNPQRPFY